MVFVVQVRMHELPVAYEGEVLQRPPLDGWRQDGSQGITLLTLYRHIPVFRLARVVGIVSVPGKQM